MNKNLLGIIKRITAEQGESILSDPKKLKAFVSDYAKDEPKEDRVAFGRAIENGFYDELKYASSVDRPSVKASLVSRLQGITGFDAACCRAAVDLLEEVMYGTSSPAPVTQTPSSRQQVDMRQQKSVPSPAPTSFSAPTPVPVTQTPSPAIYGQRNKIKKRGLASLIILSILTLGLYSLYWIYSIAKDVNTMCEGDGKKTGGLLKYFFLCILTFGIYSWAWHYMLGDRLQDNAPRYNLNFKESGSVVLIWIILGSIVIIGPFIALHIIIKNTNALAEEYNKRI